MNTLPRMKWTLKEKLWLAVGYFRVNMLQEPYRTVARDLNTNVLQRRSIEAIRHKLRG